MYYNEMLGGANSLEIRDIHVSLYMPLAALSLRSWILTVQMSKRASSERPFQKAPKAISSEAGSN